MAALYLLVPVAFLFVGAAILAFLWAVDDGQFDDPEGPAVGVIMEDDEIDEREE